MNNPENALIDVNFMGATIQNLYIWNLKISNSNFTNAKIQGIRIAASVLEHVAMRRTNIEEIVIIATLMNDVIFMFARINKISIQNCPVIGDNLNFSYATISTGEVRGGIILSGATEARTEGITETEKHESAIKLGLFGGATIGALSTFLALSCQSFEFLKPVMDQVRDDNSAFAR